MAWLRLDDGFAEHPKIVALGDEAAWRWVRTLCYCARRRDPRLTGAVLERALGWTAEGVAELVALELLEEHGDGYYSVHDWHRYNGARTPAERMRDYRRRLYGEQYGERGHGGRRGQYASDAGGASRPQTRMAASSVTGVTAGEGNANVTTRARDPHPHEDIDHPSELQDPARARARARATSPAAPGVLPLGTDALHELELARLVSLLPGADAGQVDAVRAYASRVPEAALARVREALEQGRARDRVGYVLGALRREAGETGAADAA